MLYLLKSLTKPAFFLFAISRRPLSRYSMFVADLNEIKKQYEVLFAKRLLITRHDETTSYTNTEQLSIFFRCLNDKSYSKFECIYSEEDCYSGWTSASYVVTELIHNLDPKEIQHITKEYVPKEKLITNLQEAIDDLNYYFFVTTSGQKLINWKSDTNTYYSYDSYHFNTDLFHATDRLKEKSQIYALIIESEAQLNSKYKNMFSSNDATLFVPYGENLTDDLTFYRMFFVIKTDIDRFKEVSATTADLADIVYVIVSSRSESENNAKIIFEGPSTIGKSFFALNMLDPACVFYETDSNESLDTSLISSSRVIVLGNKYLKHKDELLGTLPDADVFSFRYEL